MRMETTFVNQQKDLSMPVDTKFVITFNILNNHIYYLSFSISIIKKYSD